MNETKSLWQSKAVWGSVVAILSSGLAMLGYTLGAEEQAILVGVVTAAISSVGSLLGLYGRVVATKTLK